MRLIKDYHGGSGPIRFNEGLSLSTRSIRVNEPIWANTDPFELTEAY